MIDLVKDVLGLELTVTDYDLYLVIICAIGILWIVKMVIMAIYNSVLHIFI